MKSTRYVECESYKHKASKDVLKSWFQDCASGDNTWLFKTNMFYSDEEEDDDDSDGYCGMRRNKKKKKRQRVCLSGRNQDKVYLEYPILKLDPYLSDACGQIKYYEIDSVVEIPWRQEPGGDIRIKPTSLSRRQDMWRLDELGYDMGYYGENAGDGHLHPPYCLYDSASDDDGSGMGQRKPHPTKDSIVYVPTYKECKANKMYPKRVIDLVITQDGAPIYFIEICHKNPVSDKKIKELKEMGVNNLIEIDANWILSQVKRPRILKIKRWLI